MKKVLLAIVFISATAFTLLAVNHIVELTQAGLINWSK